MTTLSPSSSNIPAPPPDKKPVADPPAASLNIDLAQLASRFESEHTLTTKTLKQDASIVPDEISIRQMMPSKSFSTLDETSLFYYGADFAHLDSTAITRVASMSPEESFKAELDLEKNGSDRYDRLDRPYNGEKAVAQRHRAFSAPQAPVDLSVVSKKLTMHVNPIVKRSGVAAEKETARIKPTAQEWVADIDCVSDIFGAMLADGDRIGPFV